VGKKGKRVTFHCVKFKLTNLAVFHCIRTTQNKAPFFCNFCSSRQARFPKKKITHPPPIPPLQPVHPPPPPPGHVPQVLRSVKPDPFYGHEYTSRLCARFITHLFASPEYPPTATHAQAKLPYFIPYALHRTKLHSSVTFAALILLQRLKARFPTARGSSGHRLFISAFMIASKVICDDTYSNSPSSPIQVPAPSRPCVRAHSVLFYCSSLLFYATD
jgi:hypothetical protein